MRFLIAEYNRHIENLKLAKPPELGGAIKWSETLKRNLASNRKLKFNPALIIKLHYRPFYEVQYYAEKLLSDRLTSNHFAMFGPDLKTENPIIAVSAGDRPFNALATKRVADLHFNGDSLCLPMNRFTDYGHYVENISDWALKLFRTHYDTTRISRQDIFNYVYAVLHHPAYLAKYALNLRRNIPRVPLYDDFRKWATWGERLVNLHMNYAAAKPYRLKREDVKASGAVQPRPRLISRRKRGLIEVDSHTKLTGLPDEAWEYRIGTYNAIDWVLERYKERKPKDPTIQEKFNTYRFADYKEEVIGLLRRLCTVSVETAGIRSQMPSETVASAATSNVIDDK